MNMQPKLAQKRESVRVCWWINSGFFLRLPFLLGLWWWFWGWKETLCVCVGSASWLYSQRKRKATNPKITTGERDGKGKITTWGLGALWNSKKGKGGFPFMAKQEPSFIILKFFFWHFAAQKGQGRKKSLPYSLEERERQRKNRTQLIVN